MTKATNMQEMENKMLGLLGLVGASRYLLKKIEWSIEHVDNTLEELDHDDLEPIKNTLYLISRTIHDVYVQLVEIETLGKEDE